MRISHLLPLLRGELVYPGRVSHLVGAPDAVREVVRVEAGLLAGVSTPRGRAFLGIPYAAPPIGPLRWRAPQPVAGWQGECEATRTGSPAVQTIGQGRFAPVSGSEDCLYLNVYTPPGRNDAPAGGWPVMVFLHGGAFALGAADNYDPSLLAAEQRVMVVAPNYRMGAFGFLAHPDMAAEQPDGGSGNFGLLDQQAALRWVRDNVAAFGGDPSQVTLFGESAGAWSTSYQMLSPGAAGLVHRAILQSGTAVDPLSIVPVFEAERAGATFAEGLGASGIEELRALPATQIARAPAIRRGIMGPGSWGPVWGEGVIPTEPARAFAESAFQRMPVIVGTNSDEGRLFGLGIRSHGDFVARVRADWGADADAVLARYPAETRAEAQQAFADVITDARFAHPADRMRRLLAGQVPVYGYRFDDDNAPFALPHPWAPMATRAYHAGELAYVFGTRWVLANPARFAPAQAALARRIRDAWGAFARGEKLGDWPRFTAAEPAVKVLSPNGDRVEADFAERYGCAFWDARSG
ncbi:carboxylesterase/lipase family protein [Sphingomonas sp. ac-8]|uniref:carboxylesterase/lipase family protein n=1 Tax=Sphingomonas sp. ac-8 TaxID=3242977 RepID=UPI003A7F87B7